MVGQCRISPAFQEIDSVNFLSQLRMQSMRSLRNRAMLSFLTFVVLSPQRVQAADASFRLPENVRPSPVDLETVKRTSTTLEKLGKNLVLERTRGEGDIALYQKAASAVVYVQAKNGSGTGAIISERGHIITNWHVVAGEQRVMVYLKPRNNAALRTELAFTAVVEKYDQVSDLALLRIVAPPKNLATLTLGNPTALSVGQDVSAIGHPGGEVWTFTKGVISAIREKYEWRIDSINHTANIVQTQTPINPGNSGGPLLDASGKIVGINTFVASQFQGLNYAVAADTVGDFLKMESSRAAPVQPLVKNQPRCEEVYDTLSRGWNDFVGCYQDSVAPPPDIWMVFRSANKIVSYIAMDSDTSGKSAKVDLVKKSLDPSWNNSEMYVDSDCNGSIDLIVKFVAGNEVSSRLPPANLRMTNLVPEMDVALKKGRLPYRQLRVCQ